MLAIASNGLHTNGYSLVRLLMEKMPAIKLDKVEGITFIEQIMKPHTPYYKAIRELFGKDCLHGMAHITGGGIAGNLCRVIPEGLCAEIDLERIRILPIFRYIKAQGRVSDEEMLRTFNMGVGFVLVISGEEKEQVIGAVSKYYDCYEIGTVKKGSKSLDAEHLNTERRNSIGKAGVSPGQTPVMQGRDKIEFAGRLHWI